MVPVNYWAVVSAAVASMVLGFVWYGPLFGKLWMKLSGMNPEQMSSAKAKGMGKNYAITFVGTLLMSFVFSHALVFASAYMNVSGVQAGLSTGFWNWLGFVVPVSLGSVLWENKSWKYWGLGAAYHLAMLLLMGVILAMWP